MRLRIQKNHMNGETFKVMEDAYLGNINESEDGIQVDDTLTKGLYIGERSFDLVNHDEWGINISNETKQPLRELTKQVLGFIGNEASKFGKQAETRNGTGETGFIGKASEVVANAAKLWYSVSGQRFDGRAVSRKIYTDSTSSINFKFELYITPHGTDMYTIVQNYVSDVYFLHSLLLYGKNEESTDEELSKDSEKTFKDYLTGSGALFDSAAKYQSKYEPEATEEDDGPPGVAGGSTLDKVSYIFLHCTASKYGSRAIVNEWHTKGRKWSAIGYNYLINNGFVNTNIKLSSYKANEDGTNHDGRYVTGTSSTISGNKYAIGAHAKGYNSKSIGVSIVGPYLDGFTLQQLEGLRELNITLIKKANNTRMQKITYKQYKKDKDYFDEIVNSLKPFVRKIGTINKDNMTYKHLFDPSVFLVALSASDINTLNELKRKYESRIKLPVCIAGHNTISPKTCPVYNVDLFSRYVESNSTTNTVECMQDKFNLVLPEVSGTNVDEAVLVASCEKKAQGIINKYSTDDKKLTLKNFTFPAEGRRAKNPNGTEGSGGSKETYLSSKHKENVAAVVDKGWDVVGKFQSAGQFLSGIGLTMIAPPYINLEVFNTGTKEDDLGILSQQVEFEKQKDENLLFQMRNMLVNGIKFEYANTYYRYQSNPSPNKQGNIFNHEKEHDSFIIPSYIKVTIDMENSLKNPFEVYIDQFKMYDLLKDENYVGEIDYTDYKYSESITAMEILKKTIAEPEKNNVLHENATQKEKDDAVASGIFIQGQGDL